MAAIQLGAFPPRQGPAPIPGDQTAFVRLAGCTTFNLIPQAADMETAVEGAADVKRLLAGI